MSVIKYLSNQTPNISEQSNTKDGLLWDISGRLTGFDFVSAIDTGGPEVTITIGPGSFVHNGIVVTETDQISHVFNPKPTFYPLDDEIFLIAQANGSNQNAAPIYSLIRGSVFRSQLNSKNYAAVLAVYKRRLAQENRTTQILLSTEDSNTWTNSPLISTGIDILNGVVQNGYINGTVGQIIREKIAPSGLSSDSAIDKVTTQLFCFADAATATGSTFTITLAGAATAVNNGIIVATFNGIQVLSSYLIGQSRNTVLNNLHTAILNKPEVIQDILGGIVPDPISVAGSVMTIASNSKGQVSNYTLSTSFQETPSVSFTQTTLQTITATQNYIQVTLLSGTAPDVVAFGPITIYPALSSSIFTSQIAEFLTGSLNPVSFDAFHIKIEDFGPGFSRISRAIDSIHFTEGNAGIDPAPPQDRTHWSAGGSVAVGASDSGDSGLTAHRLARVIDHPDRSVTQAKIQLGAVGKDEIDARLIGTGYKYQNPPGVGSVPAYPIWTLTTDLTIKDISDYLKYLAQIVIDPTITGLRTLFGIGHSIVNGFHKSAKWTDNVANTGMIVDKFAGGDSTLDPATDTTRSQFWMRGNPAGGSDPKDVAFYRRTVAMGAPISANVEVVGKTSQAFAGLAGKDIIEEDSTDPAYPVKRFARTEAGRKDLYGIKSLNGIHSYNLNANESTLFSGNLCFLRVSPVVGTENFLARIENWDQSGRGAGTVYDSMIATAAPPNPLTSTGDSLSSSYTPTPAGAAFQCQLSNPSDILTKFVDHSAYYGGPTMISGGSQRVVGFFPSPSTVGNTASAVTNRDLQSRYGMQWFYLPFPEQNIYDKIKITTTIFMLWHSSATSYNIAGVNYAPPNFGGAYGGMMAAPAYDAIESGAAITGVTGYSNSPTSLGFNAPKLGGIIRRHPWVLTPTGLNYPSNNADVNMLHGAYYNPGTGLSYNPKAYFSNSSFAAFDRLTNIKQAGISSGGLFQFPTSTLRSPLPYYDKRDGTTPAPGAGILIDLAQASTYQEVQNQTTAADGMFEGSVRLEFEISLKDFNNTPLTITGGRKPDGIAFTPHRFDIGVLAGSSLMSSVNSSVMANLGVPYSNINTRNAEVPVMVSMTISGIAKQLIPIV